MGFNVKRAETGSEWQVEKDGVLVFESLDQNQVVEYLFKIGVLWRGAVEVPTDPVRLTINTVGPSRWLPPDNLSRSEVARVIFLEREEKLTPHKCLERIGRAPPVIQRLARVSESEAESICELRRAGWSYRKINELTGRNTNTIAKVIAEDLAGARRSDKKWRCPQCGALNLLDLCESCRIKRISNSRRLNERDARRHGAAWWRKIHGRERRVKT